MRLWPSGPGTTPPRWTGGFDSRQALFVTRPVTQRVWRPARQAGETGSSPVQGADSGRGRAARQPSDTRYKAGSTPAGPTDSLVEQPGVLTTLTLWRSLVQIQPGL